MKESMRMAFLNKHYLIMFTVPRWMVNLQYIYIYM